MKPRSVRTDAPYAVELRGGHAVRLVGAPEVGDPRQQVGEDRRIHRLVDPRLRDDPAAH